MTNVRRLLEGNAWGLTTAPGSAGSCSLHGLTAGGWDSPWQGSGVVVDQPPVAVLPHKNVGGLDQRRGEVVLDGRGHVFDARDPRRVAEDVDKRPADRHSHLQGRAISEERRVG